MTAQYLFRTVLFGDSTVDNGDARHLGSTFGSCHPRKKEPPQGQDTIPVRAKKTLLAVVGWGVPRRRPPSPEVNVGPLAASTSDENERFLRTAPIPANTPTLNKGGQGGARRDNATTL